MTVLLNEQDDFTSCLAPLSVKEREIDYEDMHGVSATVR